MVWMCLDICGQGGEIASKNLQELSRHLDVVSGVSFEKYTLGPGAQLVTFDITEVILRVWNLLETRALYKRLRELTGQLPKAEQRPWQLKPEA